jgi:membrane protein DedA with SNARE-associated domain/rhodanese-related sulfurtransferase
VSLESWTFGCETRGLLQREAARDFTSEKNKFMNIPSVEPLYTTSLEEVFWGVILVGITKTLHGLPALPFLLSAGALAATGKFNPFLGIGVTVLACIVANTIWFYLGRYRGIQVLGLLCRLSLEPDSCVRRTQNVFTRYGLRGLLISKFLPGLNTVAAPLAGMAGVHISRFLFVDAVGSLLYGVCFIVIGFFFSSQIEQIVAVITNIGGSALSLMVGLIIMYVAYKYWQRQRLLSELRTARITVAELRQKLDEGENPIILDLRSGVELKLDPSVIRGALHVEMSKIEEWSQTVAHDRDIIVYCSCPNEVTSARFTLLLKRKGFNRIRPLLGGIDAWRKQKYPTDQYVAVD